MSVAVRRRLRYAGHSWSGALKLTEAPLNDWTWCAWQLLGQWCMVSVQLSAVPGREPSWGSLADPLAWIVSPTIQTRAASGPTPFAGGVAVMKAGGGA